MSEFYKEAGVDIELGDVVSKIAGDYSQKTFKTRKNKIGASVRVSNDFAGVMDFGAFYLVKCCDTLGTKIDLADKNNFFDNLGSDLLAMVADDAVCIGAEVVSITNTFETNFINKDQISTMMKSLSDECIKQSITISGGEIAEVGEKIQGTSWGADAIGILEKNKIISTNNIKEGDIVISLQEHGVRCNGLSLVRKILKENNLEKSDLAKEFLKKSIVYHDAVLNLHGRFEEDAKYEIKGISHITGGGIPGNFRRVLRNNNLGVDFFDLHEIPLCIQELIKLKEIPYEELFKIFNMGNGMLMVCNKEDSSNIIEELRKSGINAKVAGVIKKEKNIKINFNNQEVIYDVL